MWRRACNALAASRMWFGAVAEGITARIPPNTRSDEPEAFVETAKSSCMASQGVVEEVSQEHLMELSCSPHQVVSMCPRKGLRVREFESLRIWCPA